MLFDYHQERGTMKVNLYATFRQAVGAKSIDLDLPEVVTVQEMLGEYEHFGYQLIVGDTQFKGAELSLSAEGVLILTLIAYDGEYPFPLNVISGEYAVTSGLGSGFAYTVKFMEDKGFCIIDFGGITFRKAL